MNNQRFRVFSARWWDDAACTRPITMPRRKRTIRIVETQDEARAICRAHNLDSGGNRIRRPFGSAYEFETI
jgi:hypothetical protein